MTGVLIGFDGGELTLPPLLSWSVSLTSGEPCDSFRLCCGYQPEMAAFLPRAARFCALHGGKTAFTGVVDEYEISLDAKGRSLSVCGRGMAALLLDNEAAAAQFGAATLPELLARYAAPYGIACEPAALPSVQGFTVEPGWSCWRAISAFATHYGGPSPRFSPEGRLLFGGGGRSLTVDGSVAVGELRLRERRYGVISRIDIVNRRTGESRALQNEGFIAQGGSRRRITYVSSPGDTAAAVGRAASQLRDSQEKSFDLTLTLPSLFAAAPGDSVTVELSEAGLHGTHSVREAVSWADGSGYGTTLTLSRGR